MSKLITCIWFANNDGEEAAKYYIDVFNSASGDHQAKIGDITKAPKASEEVSGRPQGSVLTAEYELDGMVEKQRNCLQKFSKLCFKCVSLGYSSTYTPKKQAKYYSIPGIDCISKTSICAPSTQLRCG